MTPQVDGIHYHHTTLLLHPATPNFICIFLHFLAFFCFLRQDLMGEPSPRVHFYFDFFRFFRFFSVSWVVVHPPQNFSGFTDQPVKARPLQVGSLDLYHRRRLDTTVMTSFSSTPYSLKTLYLSSGRFLPSSLHM